MSIAVGFRVRRGVVLCADRQFTKGQGLKFEGEKILWSTFLDKERGHNIAMAFVGDPERARKLFRGIAAAVSQVIGKKSENPDLYMDAIRPVLKSKDAKLVESLIALQTKEPLFLFRTKGDFIDCASREYIGTGDSSAVRLLADITGATFLEAEEAIALGLYMVSVANRYMEFCGGGANALVMEDNKPMRILSKSDCSQYKRRFFDFEKLVSAVFTERFGKQS